RPSFPTRRSSDLLSSERLVRHRARPAAGSSIGVAPETTRSPRSCPGRTVTLGHCGATRPEYCGDSNGPNVKTGTAICSTSTSTAANVNTDWEENGPHNETSIAVNPTDTSNGGANDYQL